MRRIANDYDPTSRQLVSFQLHPLELKSRAFVSLHGDLVDKLPEVIWVRLCLLLCKCSELLRYGSNGLAGILIVG